MHLQRKNTSFFGVRHKKHDVVQGTQGKMPQRTQKRGFAFIKFQFHFKKSVPLSKVLRFADSLLKIKIPSYRKQYPSKYFLFRNQR